LTEPTKAKSWEPAYSQALIKNKIDNQGGSKSKKSQVGRQSDGYGGWCLESRQQGRQREEEESG